LPYSTSDFARLYGIVTDKLSTSAQNGWVVFRAPAEEQWFSYLIVVFEQLFEDWERDPLLENYLAALERWPPGDPQGRAVHRAFRLAGHVYLHVGYDLVRGLAGTLHTQIPVQRSELHVAVSSSDAFARPPPQTIHSRTSARLIFLGATPAFAEALRSADGVDLLGEVTLLAKALGLLTKRRRRQVLQVMAQWVLALRTAALILAEAIADSPAAERTRMVQRLREGIVKAQTDVAARFNTTDIELWFLPSLSVALPVALVTYAWHATLVVAGIGVLGSLLHIRRRQRAWVEAIEVLGYRVYGAIVAAGRGGEGPGSPLDRKR
jgi:hypothetical protein